MAKRTATSQLNHENWDVEEEREEAGTFKTASEDSLQKRVIKTAKRRIKSSENIDSSKSIFASFSGFKPNVPVSNSSGSTKPNFGFLGGSTSTPTTNGSMTAKDNAKTESSSQQKYLSDLQQLNRSVSEWIKTHVDSNPACILTPVFKDYEKYLKELQDERDSAEKSGSAVSSAPKTQASFNFVNSSVNENKFSINAPKVTDNKSFKFIDNNVSLVDSNKPQSVFSLPEDSGKSPLLKGDSATKTSTPSIFGNFKSDSPGTSLLKKPDPASLMINPFTSTNNKPVSSNGSAPTSESKDDEEEESDEPPKVEFTPIQEEGSVFSTRCKVFVKKDNNYKDKGVGTLFIKKVGENKHQLLVRAETVLGNVLLNVLLSSSIPTKRMGKNNVVLVCLPTPQDPPPPTTVLLRVKTAEEADDLLKTIESYKP